ncbi:MAG TPA: VWA domain-containing protein [Chloroflexota bacterium]|nr:VWA domain-containing protein [Chloroflexota bacterium]
MSQFWLVVQSLKLEHAVSLWLLTLAVPLVLLVPRLRLRQTAHPLQAAILAVRLVVSGLLILALAEPRLRPPGQARAMVFAIDVSDSTTPDQQQWARAWVQQTKQQLPPGSWTDTLEFASSAQRAADTALSPAGGSTDIAAALHLAGTLLPRDSNAAPEIVLLTDGWQTTANPPLDALPPGVAVSFVALPQLAPGIRAAAVIHTLSAPPVARVGDTFDIIVDLQAALPVDAQLRVWLDQTVVASGPMHLQPGDTRISFTQRADIAGFSEVRADLQLGSDVSRLISPIVVKPAGRVLVLQDDANTQADALVTVLGNEGLVVERRSAASVPPSASALGDFDGVVLVNTAATSLSLDQQRTLVSFVQDMGRGVLVIGGSRAFSPGGYQGTVLDDLLPVSSEPPIEPQQGSLALFLVIDRSGSMDILTGGGSATGGASKLAMAREAAIEAAGLLQPQDTIGVISFDTSFQWVVPPTRLSSPDDVKRAQAQIATIKPGGGTSILPPLEAAFQAALQNGAPLKHIILLTDGESNDRGYEDLLARMQPARVTLSTLAIGSDADTRLLSNLARLGGGRYYFTERSTQIPRIASKETTILTRNAVVEGRVAPVVAEPSPILRSISGDLPALGGYVATTRKERAITALETERGHPLLAHWQFGLGRVVAWTSDAQQGWASAWQNWSDAGHFWSQAVRWSLPAPVRSDFQPFAQVGPDGRQVTLSIESLGDDGHFVDLQDTRATVLGPDGTAREVTLPQTAPGVYTLDTRATQTGTYRVLFKQGSREEVAAFSTPDSIEQHSVGLNRALLESLARTSGGQEWPNPTAAARPANGQAPAIDLWPWLLLAALVLLPADVFIRRRS